MTAPLKICIAVDSPEELKTLSHEAGRYGFSNWLQAKDSPFITQFDGDNGYVFEFLPHTFNMIYVFDGCIRPVMLENVDDVTRSNRDWFNGELRKIEQAEKASRVALDDYKGQYANPVFQIFRPIFDHELISLGRVSDYGQFGEHLWLDLAAKTVADFLETPALASEKLPNVPIKKQTVSAGAETSPK